MIRAKITPFDGGLTVEWAEVDEAGNVGAVHKTETFRAPAGAGPGWSYVTCAGFAQGEAAPGTFWLDAAGRRHFVLAADPGAVGLFGGEV